jgi:UDP-N-acetylmuramate--alanine ligase
VGIGGTGMSAIARVLLERGETVTGSDRDQSAYSQALEEAGVQIRYGHFAEAVVGADLVVASSAIPDDNPELVAARAAGIPVMRRQGFLGELTQGFTTVAVAGSHGKTTTTGLLAFMLDRAGLAPSFIVGGELADFGVNARAAGGEHFVIEADEYDRAFLGLHPQLALITNVEHDHPDCFPTPADFQAAFEAFVDQVSGELIVCLDDPGAAALGRSGLKRITYGLGQAAEWRAEEIRPNGPGGSDFLVLRQGKTLGLVRTRLPGIHNVRNALGGLAAADALHLPFTDARDALADYHGAGRRFEVIGEAGGVTVIDDYGHHPSEIRATLAAARLRYPGAKIWAVFQPHTYSRTRAMIGGFAVAFGDADHVIVLPIFAAREAPDPAMDGQRLAERIQHADVTYAPGLEAAAQAVLERIKPEAVLVTLSAGDGNQVGRLVLDGLRAGKEGARDE